MNKSDNTSTFSKPISRRGFAKGLLVGAAATGFAKCRAHSRELVQPEGASLSYGAPQPVALGGVPKGSDEATIRAAIRMTAEAATDFAWLSEGDTVLIKPACNSGNPYPATTDPLALAEMIAILKERGAGRVVVADMSGVESVRFSEDSLSGSTRELMHSSGMGKAVEDAGGELAAFEEAGWEGFYEESPTIETKWTGPIRMPNLAREADHIVLMPRCGRHVLLGATLGMKNAVGWWRHDTRLEYHRQADTIQEKTAESNWIPTLLEKQRLVLTSATKVLATFGPDKGEVIDPEVGLIVASPNVVAHDMAILALLLETRAGMAESDREGMVDDPHGSPFVVDTANRVVTYWLGSLSDAWNAETLNPDRFQTLFEDRVLRRAFEIMDGVPKLEFVQAGADLPQELILKLAKRTAIPGTKTV